jgi:peptidoglycan/LPS O-acetylase OafA/YrhL
MSRPETATDESVRVKHANLCNVFLLVAGVSACFVAMLDGTPTEKTLELLFGMIAASTAWNNRRELNNALKGGRVSAFFYFINGLFVLAAVVGLVTIVAKLTPIREGIDVGVIIVAVAGLLIPTIGSIASLRAALLREIPRQGSSSVTPI